MITKTFECAEHEEFGSKGWREIGKDHFQPLQGLAVAHDCLEHFPDDDGSIEGELQALGAMFHVRNNALLSSHHEHWENLESDMTDIYRLWRWEEVVFNDPTPAMEKKLSSKFDWVEEQIGKLIEHLPEYLFDNHHNHDDEAEQLAAKDNIASFVKRVPGWLRHGFRRARRRHGTDHNMSLPYLFKQIVREADENLERADPGVHKLKVTISVLRAQVYVVLIEPDYHEDDY